jgi:hypothetical protein
MISGTSLRNTVLALVLAGGAVAAAASPASASEPPRVIDVQASGTCDTTAGQWVVTWTLNNPFTQSAAIGNVQASPAVTGLPATIAAGTTATATSRVNNGSLGTLNFDATWADGAVTGVNWQFQPWTPCTKS